MAKLKWDQIGERLYETGVQQGVLYPAVDGLYPTGIAWNGLISVSESPEGAEPKALYADNIQYLNLMSKEKFKATIEAYTSPKEFDACDGSVEIATGINAQQQTRTPFGLVYKTSIGNDVEFGEHGYKIHVIYGCMASPSEKAYKTEEEDPEAITLSWDLSTTPVPVTGFKPTSKLVIDSTTIEASNLLAIEEVLFGKDGSTDPVVEAIVPSLPLPDALIAMMA